MKNDPLTRDTRRTQKRSVTVAAKGLNRPLKVRIVHDRQEAARP